ncbi:MAG: amidase, partial [Pseudomonadota bacterium]
TTLGDPEVDSAAPISDAVALRLQDRGGVILGKTNVPYLGLGEDTDNPRFGLTVNPWDASRSTAGSSGGAAAALAAGMGWLAHGSDLGGSIRGPASHCGVVGLRPSPGRVGHGGPGTRRMPLDLLNVDGPMARDVGDVGLFLDALAGFTPHDPCATDAAPGVFAAAALTPRLPAEIIALPEMDGVRPAPEVRAVISAALEQLSGAGVAIREHDPARDGLDFAGVADAAYTLRLGAMRARSSPEHLARIAPFLPEIARRTYEDAERLELDAYLAAGERQQGLIRAMGAVLSSGRMLLTPAVSHAPKRHRRADPPPPQPVSPETASHWAREAVFAYAITLSLCPAIVLPAGRTPQGLPVGVQLVGPPRGEAALLSAAKAVEEILALPQVLPIDPRPAGAGPL